MMMTDDDNELSYSHSYRTPLHFAVDREDCQRLTILLQNGEDPNIQDFVGNSPLHYLLSHNSELVETLVNHGANVNSKNKYDRTPLHVLVSNKVPCVKDARLKSVKMLLEKGAYVNAQDCRGSTPLHDLVRCLSHDDWHPLDDGICDLLLGYGANVQLQDLDGYTPLHITAGMQSRFTAKLLESTSGKSAVNITDKSGEYPLHTAVRHANLEGLKLLLDNGANINCKNGSGQTALHLTSIDFRMILRNSKDFVELLLQRGADVNSQDNDRRTSLDHAAKQHVEYSDNNVFCGSSILHEHIDILLDWGALFSLEDASWKRYYTASLSFDVQIKYEIRRNCLGLPPQETKPILPTYEFQRYEKDCRTEVNRMKAERHGNISLYDIFHQQIDPFFLWNECIVSTLRSTNLKYQYPIYSSLLSSTNHRSKERVQLFDFVSFILQTPLPLEVMRYIMTFVDNNSLKNVIKAKDLL